MRLVSRLGSNVLIGLIVMAFAACARQRSVEQPHMGNSDRAIRYIALRLDATANGAGFIYAYHSSGKTPTIKDVFNDGLFFNSLDKLVAFAASEGLADVQYHAAVAFLKGGHGPLANYDILAVQGADKTRRGVRPDTASNHDFSHDSKLGTLWIRACFRDVDGGIVFPSPCGVTVSESWALATGVHYRSECELPAEIVSLPSVELHGKVLK